MYLFCPLRITTKYNSCCWASRQEVLVYSYSHWRHHSAWGSGSLAHHFLSIGRFLCNHRWGRWRPHLRTANRRLRSLAQATGGCWRLAASTVVPFEGLLCGRKRRRAHSSFGFAHVRRLLEPSTGYHDGHPRVGLSQCRCLRGRGQQR